MLQLVTTTPMLYTMTALVLIMTSAEYVVDLELFTSVDVLISQKEIVIVMETS